MILQAWRLCWNGVYSGRYTFWNGVYPVQYRSITFTAGCFRQQSNCRWHETFVYSFSVCRLGLSGILFCHLLMSWKVFGAWYLRFFTPASMKIVMLWDVTLCSSVGWNQHFRWSWCVCLHGTVWFLKVEGACSFETLLCTYQTGHHPSRFEVSTAVLRIQVLWDVMLCHWDGVFNILKALFLV